MSDLNHLRNTPPNSRSTDRPSMKRITRLPSALQSAHQPRARRADPRHLRHGPAAPRQPRSSPGADARLPSRRSGPGQLADRPLRDRQGGHRHEPLRCLDESGRPSARRQRFLLVHDAQRRPLRQFARRREPGRLFHDRDLGLCGRLHGLPRRGPRGQPPEHPHPGRQGQERPLVALDRQFPHYVDGSREDQVLQHLQQSRLRPHP